MTVCVMISLLLVACGGDNNDEPSDTTSKEKWYVSPRGFATASDFYDLNTAIDNHEELSNYGKYSVHYAEVDEFIMSDGSFYDGGAHLGRFRNSMENSYTHVIHIIDDMTAEKYQVQLFTDAGKQNTYGNSRLWYFDAGRHFGMMAYYVNGMEVLVYKKTNNTLVFSNGDILILSSAGLQGNDGIWKPFTPKF